MHCPMCGSPAGEGVRVCKICGETIPLAMPAAASTIQNTVLDNRYEIIRQIGGGGMGAVYLAKDRRLNKHFVIKEMLEIGGGMVTEDKVKEWFQREAQILCELRHPNIPVVIDFFSENSKFYLVMDYIEGKSLDSLPLPMPAARVTEFAKTALDIIQFLHEHEYIHRDIKTEHFIVEEKSGKVFLVDFGTARILKVQSSQTAIGTLGFAPPEQFEGKAEIRSDIYSLGAVLHHLLTGLDPRQRAPFQFEPVEKYTPDVPPILAQAVARMIKYNKDERFLTAAEAKAFLSDIRVADSPPETVHQSAAKSAESVADADEYSRTPRSQATSPEPKAPPKTEEDDDEVILFKGRLRTSPSELAKSILPPEPDYDTSYYSIKRTSVENLERRPARVPEKTERGRMLWRKNPGGGEWLADICFIKPGNLLVASFFNGEVLVLDGMTGALKTVMQMKTTTATVLSSLNTCMDISPSGSYLAQGLDSTYTVVWDLPAQERKYTLSEHIRGITRVAFADDETLLTSSADQFVIGWDMRTGKDKFRLRGDKSGVTSLALRKDSTVFYSGTDSGSIFAWDMKQPTKVFGPAAQGTHRKGIKDMALSASGKYLVTVGIEGLIRVWKIDESFPSKLYPQASFQGHKAGANSVIFDLKNDTFITGATNGEIKTWEAESQEALDSITDLSRPIRSIAIAQHGKYFAAASEDGTIAVWEM